MALEARAFAGPGGARCCGLPGQRLPAAAALGCSFLGHVALSVAAVGGFLWWLAVSLTFEIGQLSLRRCEPVQRCTGSI